MPGPSRRLIAPLAVLFLAGAVPAFAGGLPMDVRREILTREQSRRLDDGYLVERLTDENAAVRARAALALGRIQDVTSVDVLAAALADKDVEVRHEAAFALGQMFDPASLDALQGALAAEKDPEVRSTIVLGLGKCGDASTVDALIGLLADPALAAPAAQALGVLAQRGVDTQAAGDALGTALRSRDPEVVWRAAFAVQRGKVDHTSAGLQRALQSPDPRARLFACRAIGALGNQVIGKSVLPLLKDDDWRVRVEALRALAATKNTYYVSQASLLLDDPMDNVRLVAIETMGRLASGGGVARLRELGQSSDWRVRSAVLAARAQGTGEGALVDLRDAAKDPNWRIREAAAQAFASVPTEQSLLLIEPMMEDESPQVRTAAINSLVQFPQLEAVTYLRRGFDSDDPAVLSAAANAAAQRLDRQSVPLLVKAYAPLISPVDTDVMVEILRALGTCLNAKDEDGAVGVYTDADWNAATDLLDRASLDADARVAHAARQSLALARGEDASSAADPDRSFLPETTDIARLAELEAMKGAVRATLVTERGDIVLQLFPADAPGTVENFVRLAQGGFYNGLTFHRVVADFVIQGGDPRGDGWGGPGYAIRCEYNDVPYETGTLGMALSGKDTGGSQFFITHAPQPHLDGRYTVFGKVISGQDVVDRIQVGDIIDEVRIEGL